jgi:Ti-type conjugative transfer relaxase TraA
LLSIGAASGGYYAALSSEDYYHDGGEPPGQWTGRGAEAFGLIGQVDKDQFLNLCEGFSPLGTTRLVQNAGAENHRAGWDLTFSAPKSVSVLWSQADEATRKEIQEAQFEAVKKALEYLEREAAHTRRGHAGSEREKCDLLIATFEHGTSRAQDCHLHTHSVVLNIGIRDDGSTGTLEVKAIFQHKMTAGALYRAELAAQLENRLGLSAQRTEKNQTFEIEGVPQKLITEFSKRREAIETAMKEQGATGASRAAYFTVSTREKKQHISREELFETWQEAGREHKFFAEQLLNRAPIRNLELETLFASHAAAQEVTKSQAYFTEKEIIRRTAEAGQGRGVGIDEVLKGVDDYLKTDAINLGKIRGENYYTTPEIIALEAKMLLQVEELKNRAQSATERETIPIPEMLNAEQRKALFFITQNESISVVSGMAGTGKTTLLHSAREFWEAQGFEVRGAALSAVAAKGLEEGAGIESATIARTLLQIENGNLKLTPKTVLVLDEAGMIGTNQMAQLVGEVHKAHAKIVMVGDEKQLQPIEHGAPFKEIGNKIGKSELLEVIRQQEQWARKAVKDFAFGNAQEALRAYAERGLLTVAENRKEAINQLINDWNSTRSGSGKDSLIITGTRAESFALNRKAQLKREEAGELGNESIRVNGETLHINDRVIFTRNSTKYGVNNGDLGTVRGIEQVTRHLIVKLDNGERVNIPTLAYQHIDLGYSITTHKGQGKTVDNAFVLAGGSMQDRELAYVQMSRSRHDTKIYIERADAGDTISELSKQMNRSRQKEMAHTLIKENLKERQQEREREL